LMQEIKEDNRGKAKNWFIWNLLEDKWEHEWIKKTIIDKINTKLAEKWDYKIDKSTDIDINSFFSEKNIDISIDNDTKITITGLVNYHFYLMAECANESIWATIDDIEIKIPEESEEKIKDGTGEVNTRALTGIRGRNLSNAMSVDAIENSFGATVRMLNIPNKWNSWGNWSKDTGNPDDWVDSWGTDGIWNDWVDSWNNNVTWGRWTDSWNNDGG